MLRTELIQLINSGELWIFVGSGASVDANCPNWSQLVTLAAQQCDKEFGPNLAKDQRYLSALKQQDYPRAFSQIEQLATRANLEKYVANSFKGKDKPGEILRTLANWPAQGYVTSNYDLLIQAAIKEIGEYGGWIDVGNSAAEVHKVGSNAKKIIWHIHGALNRSSDRLVLTEEDYDNIYLKPNLLLDQLKSFFSQKRILFVGFGFKDPEFTRLLSITKFLTSPARPAFAFLGDEGGGTRRRNSVTAVRKAKRRCHSLQDSGRFSLAIDSESQDL